MPSAIEARRVSKRFPQRRPLLAPWKRRPPIQALDGVDFSVERGSIFALVGPNGAGKTTLLRILATLVIPDSGEVRVQGYSTVSHARQVRHSVGFATGDARSFYGRLTARQNLAFFATLHELSRGQARQAIDELSGLFGFDTSLDRPYEELSTGMRQRLGLARSLLNGASILLADEPTRSLDPLCKEELKGLLRRLARERGKTVVFTTHDLHEAAQLADAIGVLHEGRLMEILPAARLRPSPQARSLESVFFAICQPQEPDADVS